MKNIKSKKYLFLLLFFIWMMSPRYVFGALCTEHDLYGSVLEPADAENDGITEYVCAICGYRYTETIPKTGHHFGEYQIEVEPDCVNEGLKYRVCGDCGEIEEELIPSVVEHDFEKEEYPASCMSDGKIIYRCRLCGSEQEDIMPATGTHEYEEKISPPGCEEDGKTEYQCRHCSDEYELPLKAIGHKYREWVVKQEPTENEEGLAVRVCEHDESHIITKTLAVLQSQQTEHPKRTEQPEETVAEPKGGVFNEMDIIIAGANAVSLGIWIILIKRDWYIINWEKEQRRIAREMGLIR